MFELGLPTIPYISKSHCKKIPQLKNLLGSLDAMHFEVGYESNQISYTSHLKVYTIFLLNHIKLTKIFKQLKLNIKNIFFTVLLRHQSSFRCL